jgi:hypothetical protein
MYSSAMSLVSSILQARLECTAQTSDGSDYIGYMYIHVPDSHTCAISGRTATTAKTPTTQIHMKGLVGCQQEVVAGIWHSKNEQPSKVVPSEAL